MCVNDIICCGAKPQFFLDYIACGKNIPERIEAIVKGVADGCVQSGCALIGGETAEMPGFYGPGDYDISGTIVGVVERENIIDGKKIKPGTIILGLPSTGLHTNGYSLARKVLFDVAGYKVDTVVDGMDKSIGEALATPHRSYYPSLIDLCNKKIIQGLAHITGSGYQGNIPRILPDNVDVIIDRTTWDPPMIFKLIQQAGSVEKDEMYSTFNMGMGMLIFIDPADKAEVTAHLEAKGEKWVQIGEVVAGTKQVKFRD
jgi:phosphoribosylformylglycinamidine cyclo-ligase